MFRQRIEYRIKRSGEFSVTLHRVFEGGDSELVPGEFNVGSDIPTENLPPGSIPGPSTIRTAQAIVDDAGAGDGDRFAIAEEFAMEFLVPLKLAIGETRVMGAAEVRAWVQSRL